MANNKLSEGVGKKIVEALKKQSEIEITPISENDTDDKDLNALLDESEEVSNFEQTNMNETDEIDFSSLQTDNTVAQFSNPINNVKEEEENFATFSQNSQSFTQSTQPLKSAIDAFSEESTNFEMPNNIAVLKRLITQLPSGVTRHTGALIIRQTMEALGISMKSVLQEAQQVQDNLSTSAKQCHASITDYKKQIALLERQSQSYQKQYTALNELISLFIQTA